MIHDHPHTFFQHEPDRDPRACRTARDPLRLEHRQEPVGPEQYLSVVNHLVEAFDGVTPGMELRALLDTHPAAAELYENVNYQYAGLCRSPLESSLCAEQQARQVIERAMRSSN